MNEPRRNDQDEQALDALIAAALRQEDQAAPTVERLPVLNDVEQAAIGIPEKMRPGQKRECGAALAVGALDPGYLQRRWAPCDRAHEPGQVQLP